MDVSTWGRETATHSRTTQNHWQAVLHFMRYLIIAGLRSPIGMIASVATPLFLTIVFAFTTGGPGTDMMQMMFPGLVLFVIALSGGILATQLLIWRNKDVFKRLACTPTPVGYLAMGAAFAQLVVSALQALALVLFGMLIGVQIAWQGVLLAPLIFIVGGIWFLAYGIVIASLVESEKAAYPIFLFTILPMLFIGGALLPPEILPPFLRTVGAWLPTGLVQTIMSDPFLTGTVSISTLTAFAALTVYDVLTAWLAIRLFDWQ